MKRGSEFYCWKHREKWSSRYIRVQGVHPEIKHQGIFFTFCNDLLRGDFAAGIWSLCEVSQGKEAPDGAGRALGSRGWQSAEQRDWHYRCHKAILLSCKIQIFIHYVDPSDSDPCPRTADILYKASAACTQLNKISPASAFNQHQTTPTATSSVAKFWSCW